MRLTTGTDRETARETGKRRDNLRFIAALTKVMWRLRRSEKHREDEGS